jgi:hypothetical protein
MKRPCILFFLLLPFFSKSQEGFINHYDLGHPGMVFTNLVLHEDTLIASGIVIQDTFPYLTLLSLAKLDTNGNILTHYDYMDSLGANYSFGETPRGLLRCSDGSGYVMLGHAFERKTGLAMKIGNNGEQVWVKEYTDSNSQQDIYREIIEVGDGYIIGGYKQRLDFSTDIFVKKIDHEGEGVWEQWYGTTNNRRDYFGDIFLLDDNEYIIGGSTGPNQNVPWQQTTNTIRIFAIDSLGNEKWGWESGPSLEEIWLRGLHINTDGNWIYSTVRGEFEFDGFMKRQPRVIMRDSNFDTVKAVDLDDMDGNSNYFLDMVQMSDGGWLGVGTNIEKVENPVLAQDHGYAWMCRMDATGDTLWGRKDLVFPDTLFATGQFLHSAVELPSGSIIAAGYYASTPDPKDWGVLIKVDKNGCVDTINCSPITSTIAPFAPTKGEIKVYPNPAGSVVHFDSPESVTWDWIEVFDISGQMMKKELDTSQVDIKELPAGVYFVRLWQSDGYVTKKLIKE